MVRRAGYRIGLEQHLDVTWAHCRILGAWSVATCRALRRDWDALFALHGGPIFAVSHTPHGDDPEKFGRFCELMGFEFDGAVTCTDGVERPIYVRWR